MRHKFLGILGKVFIFTVLLLSMVIGGIFLFFSEQIKSALTIMQQQQLSTAFKPLLDQLNNQNTDEIVEFAKAFHLQNRSFEFCFENENGDILFKTENFVFSPIDDYSSQKPTLNIKNNPLEEKNINFFITKNTIGASSHMGLLVNGIKLYVLMPVSESSVYDKLIEKTVWFFILIFTVSLIMAAIFSNMIVWPVKKLAGDINRMSKLETVAQPKRRKDEIGQLANDVYAMYDKLKSTIQLLEIEIKRKKELEESQKYFFSAASHELKTPIAATEAILEGMLENVIDAEEYPSYLRECIRLMKEQNKLVTEILDIVRLDEYILKQEKMRVNLYQLVDSVLISFLPLIESKEQVLDNRINKQTVCTLDSKLFSKALSNIILNATQNSPAYAEIKLYTILESNSVKLCIWNSNAIIPDKALNRIYEPFYRADEARRREDGRTGLGLTIVKKTLDLLEIPYTFECIKGGVLFTMKLRIN